MGQQSLEVRLVVADGVIRFVYRCPNCGSRMAERSWGLEHPTVRGFLRRRPVDCALAGAHFETPKLTLPAVRIYPTTPF